MDTHIVKLKKKLDPLLSQINQHPVYEQIASIDDLCTFMEHHVFAVWDFMCLLKTLHQKIVCTDSVWLPPKDAFSANLISSILVEEEGDITPTGDYASHFDTYLYAMTLLGADTRPIENMLAFLKCGDSLGLAMSKAMVNEPSQQFVSSTFSLFELGAHELASAFTFGREAITSGMFSSILKRLDNSKGLLNKRHKGIAELSFYLDRHVELDGNEHLPKAMQMLANLAGHDEKKWVEIEVVAEYALVERIKLLSEISKHLYSKKLYFKTYMAS